MPKKRLPDAAELARSKDPNLQGDDFFDTTQRERPAGLEREGEAMLGEERAEWGTHVLPDEALDGPDPIDPSGADPFVPGTRELSGAELPTREATRDDETERVNRMQRRDPKGLKGPSYERAQGHQDDQTGGSTDPHTELTHDSAGLVDEPWKNRPDTKIEKE